MYLRNAWYVAEIAARIGERFTAVRILGEPIVLFRSKVGTVVALEDACLHRKLPLSMGRLIDDTVECGYHGMTFDTSGRCLRVPGNQPIPDRATVRSYPVAERYGFVWIWMGRAALADPGTILQIEHYEDSTWGRTEPDSMIVACNYLYITDNLLDPTHVAWVHPSSFGDPSCRQTPLTNTMLPTGMRSRAGCWTVK